MEEAKTNILELVRTEIIKKKRTKRTDTRDLTIINGETDIRQIKLDKTLGL